jgi:hypothetical protein
LLGELPKHIAAGGRAFVLCEWPIVDEEPLVARVRRAVGDEPNVLVVQAPGGGLDDQCMIYAATEHPDFGDAYARAAVAWREHYEAMKIKDVALALNVVTKSATERKQGWTSLVDAPRFGRERMVRERLEKILAARELAADGRAAVERARLRVAAGATFAQGRGGPSGNEPVVVVRLPDDALVEPMAITAPTLKLLQTVDASATVRDAIQTIANGTKRPFDQIAEQAIPAVTTGLLYGVLDIVAR